MAQASAEEEPEQEFGTSLDEPRLPADNERRIERLFAEASENRAKAYELKQELDRLGVFRDYEDRFLDLFKSAE